jgi:branched-chain amino acid transport system permease protein
MALFADQLINGCALGALYALFAIGFGLVFATLGILNAAHGTYASWAAIAAYFAVASLGLPFPFAVLLGVAMGALLALAVDLVAFQPLRARGGGTLGALITSIAAWMVLDNLADDATGHESLSFAPTSYPSGLVHLGGIDFVAMQGVAIVAVIVVTVGMHLLMRRSRFGAAMRAVGWSEAAAALSGVNPRAVVAATALLAGATSGLAGVLGAVITQNVSYKLGEGLMLKGFAAVVVGGYDDVRGAAMAGVALGIIEVMTAQYLSSSLRDGITYALLLGFLLLRPRGLFGSVAFTRA